MTTTTDEIRQLGERWAAAEVAADTTTLGSIVTDDFRLVGPFGFVLDRQQWLDRYRLGRLRHHGPDVARRRDPRVRRHGSVDRHADPGGRLQRHAVER